MLINIEDVQAIFAAQDFQFEHLQTEKVYRTNAGSKRYYQRKDHPITYTSLTTFLDGIQPNQPFLNNWRVEKALELGSSESVKAYVQATADYGTALHICFGEFVKAKKMAAHDVTLYAMEYFTSLGWEYNTVQAACEQFTKDFAALAQWAFDKNAKIYAVEMPVWDDELKIATCIDLVAEIDFYGKRQNCVINIKSGRHATDTHALQVAGEKILFNRLMGSFFGEIDLCFTLAPNDWRGTKPTYKFTNYSDSANVDKFMVMHQLAKLDGMFDVPSLKADVVQFTGEFVFGENPTNNITTTPFDTYFQTQQKEIQDEI